MSSDSNNVILNIAEDVISILRQTEQSSEPLAKRQRILESLSPNDNNLYYPDIELNEKYVSYIENALIYMSSTDGIEFEESDPRIKLEPDLKSYIKSIFSKKVKHWAIIRHDSKGTGDWIHLRDYLKYFFVKKIYNSLRIVYFYGQWYSDFLMIIDEVISDSNEPLLYRQSSDTSIHSNNNESLTDTPIASTSTNITFHSFPYIYIQNTNSINRESNELSNNLISNEDSDENIANTKEEGLKLEDLLVDLLKRFQISIDGLRYYRKITNKRFYKTFELTEELLKSIEKASLMKILIYLKDMRGCITAKSYCKCGEDFITFFKTTFVPMFPKRCTDFEDLNNRLNLIYNRISINDIFTRKAYYDENRIYSLQTTINSNLFDKLFVYIFENKDRIDWKSKTTVSTDFITNIQLNRSSDSVSDDSDNN